jgi:hypothetical protein
VALVITKMKVHYVELPDGKPLISYYRHDFKHIEIDGKYYMIDGGQEDYVRYSGELKRTDCYKLIETIREEFEIGRHPKLKDVTTFEIKLHLKAIERKLNKLHKNDSDTVKSGSFLIAVLKSELKYRKNNNID